MARYYFQLQSSAAKDSDGEDFPSDQAARDHALAVARDITKNRGSSHCGTLLVTNDAGAVVHRMELRGEGL